MFLDRFRLMVLLPLLLAGSVAGADTAMVAAASNVQVPLEQLAKLFEQQTGHQVVFSFGATGKHYAQIRRQAPFELFLAADAERPALLERGGQAVAGTRFTYAIGRLALWSPRQDRVDDQGAVLERGGFQYLAIANPRLAPYGAAAQHVLIERGLWKTLQPKLVLGESIGQAYQFVGSGNAELGFVALSQVRRPSQPITGSIWIVPQELHPAIEQQAVLIRDTPAARAFWQFLQTPLARAVLHSHGYDLPAQDG